jgi:hypothetical protein
VDAASGFEPAKWRSWIVALVTLALAVTFVLGTVGWFGAAFGIGSNCTDEFSCGSGSCAPCARAHGAVTTGGIGQWVLAAAAVTILVLGLRHPGWRRAATIAACTLIPVAVMWFAISTSMAQRSF